MFQNLNQKLENAMKNPKVKDASKYVATAGLALGVTASNAAVDVSSATTAITTDGTAAVTAIGGALIGLAGVAVVFKWVKAAIFG